MIDENYERCLKHYYHGKLHIRAMKPLFKIIKIICYSAFLTSCDSSTTPQKAVVDDRTTMYELNLPPDKLQELNSLLLKMREQKKK